MLSLKFEGIGHGKSCTVNVISVPISYVLVCFVVVVGLFKHSRCFHTDVALVGTHSVPLTCADKH